MVDPFTSSTLAHGSDKQVRGWGATSGVELGRSGQSGRVGGQDPGDRGTGEGGIGTAPQ